MEVARAVDRFVLWCQEHRAHNTCLLYQSRLRSLAAELGPHELSALTREMIEDWLAKAGRFPDGKLKAPDTRRATAIAFCQLQAWAVDHGHLAAPIVAKIEKPSGRERERIPTPEETRRLLEKASPAFALAYRALRQCGARPNELCRAQIADWKRPAPQDANIVSHGVIELREHKTAEKTGRSRKIAVGARMAELLREAIGDRQEGPIFLSPSGRPWTPQRLSTIYRKLRNAAGLPRDLCLYLARHEHGTQITRKLGIYKAKIALGHTNINTTQRYAHATDEERAADQDAFE
jgi:integrase